MKPLKGNDNTGAQRLSIMNAVERLLDTMGGTNNITLHLRKETSYVLLDLHITLHPVLKSLSFCGRVQAKTNGANW